MLFYKAITITASVCKSDTSISFHGIYSRPTYEERKFANKMNVDCQFEIYSKSVERFYGRNTAHGYRTDVVLLLGILRFAHLILNPMRGIHLRFAISSVYPAQVFRVPCSLNVLAKQGYWATFQSSKWASLLSDVRSVTPFKLQRPPTPARYCNRLFL